MTERVHSTRLRVDLNSKNSLVFSYPDLLKRHEKALKNTPLVPLLGNDEQDAFYKALLERAAKYDIDPGDDVNASDEDAPTNKDGKGDEYDYEDPFIDDSDMMLDDSYEYSQPEFDGFFVYYGTLDGVENPSSSKKKSSKKDKAPTTNGKAKSVTSFTAARKTSAKSDPIELSDSDEDIEKNKLKRSSSSSTATSKSESTNKTGPTMKKSTSSSTVTPSDGTKKAASKKSKSAVPSSSSSTTAISSTGLSSTSSLTSTTGKKGGTTSVSSVAGTVGMTLSSTQTGSSTGDKNKKVPKTTNPNQPPALDPVIEQLLEKLRLDRANETFEVKSKFPSSLRPTTLEVGNQMFRLYYKVEESVLVRLMEILPYNRFTLKKFLVTKSGPGIVEQLQKEIEKQMKLLTEAVNELMPEHIQQYEQKILEQQNQTEDGPEAEKKFKCNDTIRRIMYEILTMDMHSNSLSNEIAIYHNKPELIESETKARKNMYTKLLPCWPTGWMTTYDISRQYSTYKAKVKNTDQPLLPLPSASGSGTKRLTTVPVKRSAPSSSISTSLSNTSQGHSPGGEKRKKVSPNEQSVVNETARKDDILPESKNEQDQVTNMVDSSVDQSYSPSSQKSSSMNIASLISGP